MIFTFIPKIINKKLKIQIVKKKNNKTKFNLKWQNQYLIINNARHSYHNNNIK